VSVADVLTALEPFVPIVQTLIVVCVVLAVVDHIIEWLRAS